MTYVFEGSAADYFLLSKIVLQIIKQITTGCSAVGSALDWGSRGRKFKSCHSDHIEYS